LLGATTRFHYFALSSEIVQQQVTTILLPMKIWGRCSPATWFL